MDGQGLETRYTVASGKGVGGLEWSPDQRFIAFGQDRNVYLLAVATRSTRLVVSAPANSDQGFVPRIWLDNARLYLSPYAGSELPPLNVPARYHYDESPAGACAAGNGGRL